MMLQEGKWAITHAVLDHRVRARGLGRPQVNPPPQQPFRFNTSRTPPWDQPVHGVPENRCPPFWPSQG